MPPPLLGVAPPPARAQQLRCSEPEGESMTQDVTELILTRQQRRLVDASTAIRSSPPDRIDFLHTIQCQCGIPYRNPGDHVRKWDRRQGNATLHIEAGSAIDPKTRN